MSAIDNKTLLWMYETMVTIRRFEEECRRQADQGKLRGMHSSIGQEAVPTGICAHLGDGDYALGTHRSHHHCIAKGVNLNEMMAELLGKVTGTNRGKGGTMHIADITKGMLGANGVVGSNIPVATGAALSAKIQGTNRVSVVFFGDGASGQGTLYESMNLAGIWKLPVIFVCENNRYAEATPFEYAVSGGSVSNRADGFNIPGVTVDGQSVLDMYEVSGEAVARARAGEGPTLIEAQTYRYQGHFGADPPLGYRTEEEEAYYKERDCIERMKAHLVETTVASEEEVQAMDKRAGGGGLRVGQVRGRKPLPRARGTPHRRVYLLPLGPASSSTASARFSGRATSRRFNMVQAEAVRQLTYVQAVNEAISQEMERDPKVFIMGEDIAGGAGRAALGKEDAWGGPFRLTKGLIGQFGEERVRDTPISEAGFIGAGVGAAATGLRPIVDLMFVGFFGVCGDQITNNAAKMHYMFGGKVKIPLTIMTSTGAGTNSAAQHSETLYSIFAHFPGLKCVVPSDPHSAKGLLVAAIRDDDPVMVFNHKLLMGRTTKPDIGQGIGFGSHVPEEPYTVQIGKANIGREGSDVTLVGIGYTTLLCLEAAVELESQGYSAEVIDLLSVSPLDNETILESVKKTRKIVIVDEDYPRCSVASDVSALVAEEAFDYLDAPPTRVTPPHTPVPYSLPLEEAYMPTKESVADAALAVLE